LYFAVTEKIVIRLNKKDSRVTLAFEGMSCRILPYKAVKQVTVLSSIHPHVCGSLCVYTK